MIRYVPCWVKKSKVLLPNKNGNVSTNEISFAIFYDDKKKNTSPVIIVLTDYHEMKSGLLKIFSCWSFYLPWNQLIKMRCTIGNPMAKAKNLIMVDFGLISMLVQVLFFHKSGSYFIISAFAVYTLQFAELQYNLT